jgi:hypothetical protein
MKVFRADRASVVCAGLLANQKIAAPAKTALRDGSYGDG